MPEEARRLTIRLGDQSKKVIVSSDDIAWSTISVGDGFSMGGESELWTIAAIDPITPCPGCTEHVETSQGQVVFDDRGTWHGECWMLQMNLAGEHTTKGTEQ
jgi:hypothetical protein